MNHHDLSTTYRESSDGQCEVARWCGVVWRSGKGLVPLSVPSSAPGSGPHHIWSIGRRPDLWSNLIVICPDMHNAVHFGTRGEPQSVRFLCVLAKLRKRQYLGRPDEFAIAEMDEAAGRSIVGVIENYDFGASWLSPLRVECLRLLAEIAAERGAA